MVVCVACLMLSVSSSFAIKEDVKTELEPSSKLRISGKIHTYAKVQDNYQTPLDTVYNVREGANYRENQHFRAKTVINFMYGELGDEWFGLAQIAMDANDPDHGDAGNESASAITWGEDFSAVFAMYRPFEVDGGRPFGVMMGVIPVKATANAAYFHYFLGDIEEDFILYTAPGIVHTPGIGFDFHLSEDTGFGLAYLNGVEDASEIATLMEPDSAENFVLWGEAKKWGFGWNGAAQLVSGAGVGDLTLAETTPAGNELYSYEQKSDHQVYNTMLTYKRDIGPVAIQPAFGYQLITGDQCAVTTSTGLQMAERKINLSNIQFGLKVFTNFFDIPGQFAILYTDSNTEDFDAFGQFTSDSGNALIDAAGVAGAGQTAGWWNQSNIPALGPVATAPAIAAAGTSEVVTAIAGVDNDLHIEYRFNVTNNVELGLFYYLMNAEKIDIESSFRQVDGTLPDRRLTAMLGGVAVAAATADALLRGVCENVAKQYEWTDASSYGLMCRISF